MASIDTMIRGSIQSATAGAQTKCFLSSRHLTIPTICTLTLLLFHQDEESASDDFMEPNNRTDGSQTLEWDIEGMGAEPDDYQ